MTWLLCCPLFLSLPVLLLIVLNPQHLTALVTVVGIPLYRLAIIKVIPKVKTVRMLTKMWLGLYLLTTASCTVFHSGCQSLTPHHWPQHITNDKYSYQQTFYDQLYLPKCSHTRIFDLPLPVDNTYLWFIIPQLLNGLSSLLVSMTVFEFICAQAPRTTQGLFIGLWYATFSIGYLVRHSRQFHN